MLTLVAPLHGYGIMQKVDEMTKGSVKLGPSTLYGVTSKLLKEGIIIEDADPDGDSRRKCYSLTELGKLNIKLEHKRIYMLYENGKKAIEVIDGNLNKYN